MKQRMTIPNKLERQRGFALILALTLMGFILALLYASTALIQIEVSSSATEMTRQQAQQNCLIGLQLALGELQKHAGDDTRITACAEITDLPTSAVPLDQRFWTGVWLTDSGIANYKQAVPAYLISGNEKFDLGWLSNQPATDYPQGYYLPDAGNLDDTNSSVLKTGLDRPGGNVLSVRAPRISINDKDGAETGTYAYWVSDEGVKANVTLSQKTITDPQGNILETAPLSIPQRFAIEQLDGFTTYPYSDDKINALQDYREIPLVDATIEDNVKENTYYFDLTTVSANLLTDVKNGGLKKNLTSALADSTQFDALLKDAGLGPDNDQIFAPEIDNTTGSINDLGGPFWSQLKDHWEHFSDLKDNEASAAREQLDDQSGIFPVITQLQMFYNASLLDPVNLAEPNTHQVRFHYMPSVVLWNPYDRPIQAEDYYLFWNPSRIGSWMTAVFKNPLQKGAAKLKSGDFVDEFRNTASGVIWDQLARRKVLGIPQTGTTSSSHDIHAQGAMLFRIASPIIPPGEAIVFSPIGQTTLSRDISEIEGSGANTLHPGAPDPSNYVYNDSLDSINLDQVYPQGVPDQIPFHLITFNWWSQGLGQSTGFDVSFARSPQNLFSAPLQSLIDLPAFGTGWNYGRLANNINHISRHSQKSDPDPIMGNVHWLDVPDSSHIISNDPQPPLRWLANANPRASINHGVNLGKDSETEGYTKPANWNHAISYDTATYADIQSNGIKAAVGLDHAVYKNILYNTKSVANWSSLGELMHVPLYRSPLGDTAAVLNAGDHAFANNIIPAYGVGNSTASPWLDANQTVRNTWPSSLDNDISNSNAVYYDMPYKLNEALWDKFYFLSYNPSQFPPTDEIVFPLPNPRLEPISPPLTHGDLNDYHGSAKNLLLKGGFNINSTSVLAWKTFLSAYAGADLSAATQDATAAQNLNPILRHFDRDQALIDNKTHQSLDNEEVHLGYRALSDQEIEELAIEIVKQVKQRGPFRSLADFVNRRPNSSDSQEQHSGTLQAAINNTSLNSLMSDAALNGIASEAALNNYNLDAIAGNSTDQSSGDLTQADLLARFGSAITPRSDTFKIISEGQSIHPLTGVVEATYKCEAIVQRTVKKVEKTANELDEEKPSNPYGRRFTIVAFRWLNDSDE